MKSDELSSFVRIPLTEECKLLPSPGIYAVSVEAGSGYSKGMVIITKSEDNIPEFLINIFDDLRLYLLIRKSQASFIKKSMELSILQTVNHHRKSYSAKEEILELIY